MPSSEADSEMSYNDFDHLETNFISEYEIEAEHDVAGCDVSTPTSDEEDAAFADDLLADAEWTARYEKKMKVNEELEPELEQ